MLRKTVFSLLLLALTATARGEERSSVEPLVATAWGQGTPYNLLCPTIGTQHCQTGCVATAMAQVMRYHRWPAESAGIPAYSTDRIAVDSLPPTGFDWALMADSYGPQATDAGREAVARLMQYCGAAVTMDYGLTTSAAWEGDAARALVTYFGYATTVREVFRNMYGRTAWSNIIYKELAAGRPVIYSGMPSGFLHQFVCDGYREGRFHMNMAWQFSQNGWYDLDAIDRYPEGQAAIIGIQPQDTTGCGLQFDEAGLRYTVIGDGEVSVRAADTGLAGEVVVPATIRHGTSLYRVTTIDYSAFEDCAEMTRLALPATVDVVGHRTVTGCRKLREVSVDSGNTWYTTDGGVLMTTDSTELLAYPADKRDKNYEIHDGISEICASTFRDNTHLERVVVPGSVATIDLLAFRGCTALKEVTSLSEKPRAIEDMAFDDETYQSATLVVPAGTSARYAKAGGWRRFRTIVELPATPIDRVTAAPQSRSGRTTTAAGTESYLLDGKRARGFQNASRHKTIIIRRQPTKNSYLYTTGL